MKSLIIKLTHNPGHGWSQGRP